MSHQRDHHELNYTWESGIASRWHSNRSEKGSGSAAFGNFLWWREQKHWDRRPAGIRWPSDERPRKKGSCSFIESEVETVRYEKCSGYWEKPALMIPFPPYIRTQQDLDRTVVGVSDGDWEWISAQRIWRTWPTRAWALRAQCIDCVHIGAASFSHLPTQEGYCL